MRYSFPFADFVAKLRLEQPVASSTARLSSAPGSAITYASATVEAGLLPAFRVVIGLELLLSLVGTAILAIVRGGDLPLPLALSILGLVLFFGYLCSEQS